MSKRLPKLLRLREKQFRGEIPPLVETLLWAANLYVQANDNGAALSLLDSAVLNAGKLEPKANPLIVAALISRAEALVASKPPRYDQAEADVTEALKMLQGTPPDAANEKLRAEYTAAKIQAFRGRGPEERAHLDAGIALLRGGAALDPALLGHFLLLRINDELSIADFASAGSDVTAALALLPRLANAPGLIYSEFLVNLKESQAELLLLGGKNEEAKQAINFACSLLEITKGPDNRSKLAFCFARQAMVYSYLGFAASAQKMYEASLSLLELDSPNNESYKVLPEYAAFLQAHDKFPEAREQYNKALALNISQFGPDHPNVAVVERYLSTLPTTDGKVSGESERLALDSARITNTLVINMFGAAFAEQRTFFEQLVVSQSSIMLSVLSQTSRFEEAYEYIARWKGALVHTLEREHELDRLSRLPAYAARIRHLQKIKAQLQFSFVNRDSIGRDDWTSHVAQLSKEKEGIERDLASAFPEMMIEPRLVSVLQSSLGEREVFVDFYSYSRYSKGLVAGPNYGVVVVKRTGAPIFLARIIHERARRRKN